MIFKSSGIIRNTSDNQKPNWLYIEVDHEIGRYYGRWFRNLQRPMNGPHITIIAGEKENRPFRVGLLPLYLGKTIRFEYENIVMTNGQAYWLQCYSKEVDNMRYKLDLPPRKLHLTIGNIKHLTGPKRISNEIS